MLLHRAGTGVVGRGGQRHVATILLEQPRQVLHPAEDVLLRQHGIAHPQLPRRGGHQLGQPHGPLAGHGEGVEGGFGVDQRPDEGRLHLIGLGRRLDGAGVVIEKQAGGVPVDLGVGVAGVAVVEQQQLVAALIRHHVRVAHHAVFLHRLVDLDLAGTGRQRGAGRLGRWQHPRSGHGDGGRRGGRCRRLGGEDHHLGRGGCLAPAGRGEQRDQSHQHPCFQRLAPSASLALLSKASWRGQNKPAQAEVWPRLTILCAAKKARPPGGGLARQLPVYSCSQRRALRAGMATRTHWLCTLTTALWSSTSR